MAATQTQLLPATDLELFGDLDDIGFFETLLRPKQEPMSAGGADGAAAASAPAPAKKKKALSKKKGAAKGDTAKFRRRYTRELASFDLGAHFGRRSAQRAALLKLSNVPKVIYQYRDQSGKWQTCKMYEEVNQSASWKMINKGGKECKEGVEKRRMICNFPSCPFSWREHYNAAGKTVSYLVLEEHTGHVHNFALDPKGRDWSAPVPPECKAAMRDTQGKGPLIENEMVQFKASGGGQQDAKVFRVRSHADGTNSYDLRVQEGLALLTEDSSKAPARIVMGVARGEIFKIRDLGNGVPCLVKELLKIKYWKYPPGNPFTSVPEKAEAPLQALEKALLCANCTCPDKIVVARPVAYTTHRSHCAALQARTYQPRRSSRTSWTRAICLGWPPAIPFS